MKYFVGLCFLTCSVVPGFATTIAFNTGVNQDLGATHTFSVIAASAYGTDHLWSKCCAAGETGLGLTSDPSGEHEITVSNFLQLNLTNLIGTTLTFSMESISGSDAYSAFSSGSALATSGTAVVTGTTATSFTFTPTAQRFYLDFTATGGNVLLDSVTYTASTPEPISLALTGSGLLGLFLIRRRRAGSR